MTEDLYLMWFSFLTGVSGTSWFLLWDEARRRGRSTPALVHFYFLACLIVSLGLAVYWLLQ